MALVHCTPTADERSAGWHPASLARAVAALREDGAVVIEDVVDAAHIAALRERMLADLGRILALPEPPTQFVAGHLQQEPPPEPALLFRDVLVNDLIAALSRELLGAGVVNHRYTANTNLPGSGAQPVHYDEGQLWPGHAHPAHALVVNLPLVDMDARNGAIELWPGTHRIATAGSGQGGLRIASAELEARRAASPPLQPAVRAGSALIRDMRLWHRGMPNRSDAARPMIAMIHVCAWHRAERIPLPAAAKQRLEHPVLGTSADWRDGPIAYLDVNRAYDLDAAP